MRYFINILLIFFFISNCTLNKVVKHHGVPSLDKKKDKLTVNKSNKNDILELLGPPSTSSTFDKDLLIFIERSTSSEKIFSLGKRKLIKNNILILEIDNKGLLSEKIFLTKNDINKIEFSEEITEMNFAKKSFVYDFLSSVRQKINDPLGKRK